MSRRCERCGDYLGADAYSDDGLESSCGGLGILKCFCGGDQCVCHHHGEVECPGCSDCQTDPGFELPPSSELPPPHDSDIGGLR